MYWNDTYLDRLAYWHMNVVRLRLTIVEREGVHIVSALIAMLSSYEALAVKTAFTARNGDKLIIGELVALPLGKLS